MLRPSSLLALLTVRHHRLAPEDVLHPSLLSLRCLRDSRVCYPADWSIAGAGLSPARKTAAVGCTVVQDKGSAVPYRGFDAFCPESGPFLSRNAHLKGAGYGTPEVRVPSHFTTRFSNVESRLTRVVSCQSFEPRAQKNGEIFKPFR